MRTGKLFASMLVMSVIFCLSASAFGGKGNSLGNQSGILTLPDSETVTLKFMREEEKLARDVYLYLFDVWGQWIFENIAASEQLG